MSADYFLDTNLLIYSFDEKAPVKREKSRHLIASAIRNGCGTLSWQVVQEFLNVALHKWEKPMSQADAISYLGSTLEPLCTIYPTPSLWHSALLIQTQTQYRFYDSLIVAAALQAGVKILYSEDLQAGRRFGTMEIQNPFESSE